jgi:hypothetical protein
MPALDVVIIKLNLLVVDQAKRVHPRCTNEYYTVLGQSSLSPLGQRRHQGPLSWR